MRTIEIRPAVADDVAAITDIFNHYVLHTATSFHATPFTPEERRTDWFPRFAETGRRRLLVADEAGTIHGAAWSDDFRDKAAYRTTVETTVYLGPDSCGLGIGRELYGALLEQLELEGLRLAVGVIALPNRASEALHARLGFRRTGLLPQVGTKFGQLHDVALWTRLLGSGPAS